MLLVAASHLAFALVWHKYLWLPPDVDLDNRQLFTKGQSSCSYFTKSAMKPRSFLSAVALAGLGLATDAGWFMGDCEQNSSGLPPVKNPKQSPWSGWGGNAFNNRWAEESCINAQSAMNFTEHCVRDNHDGVSATPVVVDNIAYYPTWNGFLVAYDYVQCETIWTFNVIKYVDNRSPQSMMQKKVLFQVSRTSPALDGDILYIGTQPHALLIAVERSTGRPIADVQINPHPLAVITMSPTFYDGKVFVGAASREEGAARKVPNYKCCSFIGNFAAVEFNRNASRFNVIWNATTLPEGTEWSGAAVWGSQPSIDSKLGQVFIATGNVYTSPKPILQCYNQIQNISAVSRGLESDPCVPQDVYQESVLAFDLRTGVMNWARHLSPLDAWTAACGFDGAILHPNATRVPSKCPHQPGPDADFGMAPTFVRGSEHTPHGKDTVVIGQKNGNLYSLSAQAGTLFWATHTSPDGNVGGLSWGIAVDESSIYYTAVNSDLRTWTTRPSNQTIRTSAFGSASLLDGSVKWETPALAFAEAPPTVVNDVVLFTRTGNSTEPSHAQYDKSNGGLTPVCKRTGKILKDYPLDATMHEGIAVAGNYVLFGTGYEPPFNSSGSFYVYSVDG